MFSAVLTHASSHTNAAPRALTNVRGRTAVLAGMMIDFFCFQSGLVTSGMIDNSGTRHARSCVRMTDRDYGDWSIIPPHQGTRLGIK